MRHSRASLIIGASVSTLFAGLACSAPADDDNSGDNTDTTNPFEVTTETNEAGEQESTADLEDKQIGVGDGAGADEGTLITENESDDAQQQQLEDASKDQCGSADQPASIKGVVLAFVFDVSASMGSEGQSTWIKSLKWDPVAAATKAFFEDPESAGVSATLTLFPSASADLTAEDGISAMPSTDDTDTDTEPDDMQGFPMNGGFGQGDDPICAMAEYVAPDVGLTPLPSATFGTALDAIAPAGSSGWRLGTPTLAALEGTYDAIATMREANPNTTYSVVLVTDGQPALCGAPDDDVGTVSAAAAGVADQIPTYVIGVDTPATDAEPNPRSELGALNQVAEAGNTGAAFLISPDDPIQTAAELKAVIDQIREASFSCSIAIPPPPDPKQKFDKEKVNVAFTDEAGNETVYEYDPDCAGTVGWYFDDETNPNSIELCENVCEGIKQGAEQTAGQLAVQFGCERVNGPIK